MHTLGQRLAVLNSSELAQESRPSSASARARSPVEVFTGNSMPVRYVQVGNQGRCDFVDPQVLDDSVIARAGWERSERNNHRKIVVELTEAGARSLEKVAAQNVNRRLAIIFRDKLLVAPTIRTSSPCPEGRFVIEGLLVEADLHAIIDALNRTPTPSSSRGFGSISDVVLPYLAKGATNCMWLDIDKGRWGTNAVYRPDVPQWRDKTRGEGMDILALGKSAPQTIVCFDLGLAACIITTCAGRLESKAKGGAERLQSRSHASTGPTTWHTEIPFQPLGLSGRRGT